MTTLVDRRAFTLGPLLAASLGKGARASGGAAIRYGAAAMKENLRSDPRYRAALVEHCDIIVPMNDLKWEALRPERGRFAFEDADAALGFAREYRKDVRGHTLCWYEALPGWMKALESPRDVERELISHIETVVDRYKGVIPSWDVVNEAIAHDPLTQGPWRDMFWHKRLGARHVDIAFSTAARTDPKAELVYNDYDFENVGARFEERRKRAIELVRTLQGKNIPIHGIGIQSHLYAERAIDGEGLMRFGETLKSLGVKLLVTELDVIDWRLPGPSSERDRAAAQHVERFLKAMTGVQPNLTVITWGITDRYSWIGDIFKRDDKLPVRPLPLDDNYRVKPMMGVLQALRARR